MMANKSMKERHWARLATLCNHKFDIESDTFMLRDIMSAPLLKYKDEIEVFIIKLTEIGSNFLNFLLKRTFAFQQ